MERLDSELQSWQVAEMTGRKGDRCNRADIGIGIDRWADCTEGWRQMAQKDGGPWGAGGVSGAGAV